MIRPTLLNIILHGIGIATLWWMLTFFRNGLDLWGVSYGILWLVTVLDAFTLVRGRRGLDATLSAVEQLSLAEELSITCNLRNHSTWRKAAGMLHVQTSGALRSAAPVSWSVPARSHSAIQVPVQAWRRGRVEIPRAELRVLSALRLFEARKSIDTTTVHSQVSANLQSVQRAAARSTTLQSYLQGLRVQRRIGDGQAFEALREFQPGHDTRSIDWSVSARMRSLHVREFKEERNHSVLLAFDTGRLMSRDIEGMTRLDHSINASLHLAYVALRLGDRVGLYGFDETSRRWSAPRPDMVTLQHLVQEAQHLPYTLNVTDFRHASITMRQHLRRRSILFIFTELDPLSIDNGLLLALAPLHKKHQINVVTLRSTSAPPLGQDVQEDRIDTLLHHDLLQQQRDAALQSLRKRGIHVIDVPADTLSTALLMRYQDIKQRGLV